MKLCSITKFYYDATCGSCLNDRVGIMCNPNIYGFTKIPILDRVNLSCEIVDLVK